MSQGADPDEIGLMNIDEQLPVLEYPQPGLEIIQVRPLASMSSHSSFTFSFGWKTQKAMGHVAAVEQTATTNQLPDSCLGVTTGADITSSNQKPSSSSIPSLSLAQWRG